MSNVIPPPKIELSNDDSGGISPGRIESTPRRARTIVTSVLNFFQEEPDI